MSLATLFDRTVDLVITAAAGKDSRGNEVRTSTTIVGVPAHRAQVAADEDTADRDQQARTFTYSFPTEHDGQDLTVLSGRDRIIDGANELDVLGAPVVATSRGRLHHIEARAYLVTG